ncbi:hypothetical protein FHU36_003868 [Nonomuraea muscovyensis]|uniref:Uncharacterized protein n=1 Tax=Nonomuraea muscovyensis TaxID=1124761 RepID=A0A7X0C2L3_9ACTN|nr:hypothetical protein [Nonomuraea muscovyensis]MBB6347323.1 hypothetical protein [Nonomuraea muscovyensis]
MSTPRILIIAVTAITAVSAVLADLVIPDPAAQHAFNPAWPPQAKFHDAQYMVMAVLLGLTGLALALRRSRNPLLYAATVYVSGHRREGGRCRLGVRTRLDA